MHHCQDTLAGHPLGLVFVTVKGLGLQLWGTHSTTYSGLVLFL